MSFVIFLFADEGIEWTTGDSGSTPALVGVHAEDGVQFANVSDSLTPAIINISATSNVGIPGLWIFDVNRGEQQSENFCGV